MPLRIGRVHSESLEFRPGVQIRCPRLGEWNPRSCCLSPDFLHVSMTSMFPDYSALVGLHCLERNRALADG